MDLWVVWVIAGCLFAMGEIATTGFFLAPFAVGAFLAALIDLAGAPSGVSVGVFLVSSVLLFGFVRPIARRHTQMPPQIRTGTDALIGRTATVLETIDNLAGAGSVKLEGEVWTARAYDEDSVIPAGARVQVIEIRGATALVAD